VTGSMPIRQSRLGFGGSDTPQANRSERFTNMHVRTAHRAAKAWRGRQARLINPESSDRRRGRGAASPPTQYEVNYSRNC
jgi:hypothetical protein